MSSLLLCQKALHIDNIIWFNFSGSKTLVFERPGGSVGDVFVEVLKKYVCYKHKANIIF